jgi:hypothetical protein
MGDRDAGEVTAPRTLADFDDWALGKYRESLETTLAQSELPKLSVSREELQQQLGEVLAEQAERERDGADAHS